MGGGGGGGFLKWGTFLGGLDPIIRISAFWANMGYPSFGGDAPSEHDFNYTADDVAPSSSHSTHLPYHFCLPTPLKTESLLNHRGALFPGQNNPMSYKFRILFLDRTIRRVIPKGYGWLSKLWSLLGTLNIRCRIIIGIQKGTTILTTTHINYPKHPF